MASTPARAIPRFARAPNAGGLPESALWLWFRLDRGPELSSSSTEEGHLEGGNEPLNTACSYYHQNGKRSCQGIRALWALTDIGTDDGGLILVPSRHKSYVEAPTELLSGKDDLGLVIQPSLNAGDLLLVAATVLQGTRNWRRERRRLLSYWYAGTRQFSRLAQDPKPWSIRRSITQKI